MWPFKKKEPNPLWSPETQAQIDLADKMGKSLVAKVSASGKGTHMNLQPFSFVVFGSGKCFHGITLAENEKQVKAEASLGFYERVDNEYIKGIEVCALGDDELKKLFLSMKESME